MVDLVEQPVEYDGEEHRADRLRENHSPEVAEEADPPAEEKCSHIDHKVQRDVRKCRQNERNLYVFVKIDLGEPPAEIPRKKVEERIEAEKAPVEEVNHETAQKSGQKPFALPLHEADGDRQDQHQVRLRGEKFQD